MSVKPPCVKCELIDNSNGLFTCNGCRQNFCGNHILDHSNELRNRFEEIINEYNITNDLFLNYKQKSSDSHWQIIYKQEKEINKIKLQINEYQKTSNYSEQELDQWMIQLNKIKTELMKTNESRSFILIFKRFKIYLATILIVLIAYYIISLWNSLIFSQINGPIKLSRNKKVAEHIGPDFVSGSFRINQIYSKHIHHVRLSFEQFSSSNTFIGIIQSNSEQSISSSHGWLINHKSEEYQIFQIVKKIWSFLFNSPPNHHYRSDIEQGDKIEIEIDCINTKIALTNKRINKKTELHIDLEQYPLPWQIIIHFDHYGDRVRLQ